MKKGSLNFLGRKNPSLFDTKIKPNQDIDNNVELVLDSSAIPESGTAKVRSRPTVKHFASSSDIVQGFAVPTPKVPIFPSFNGPKINGAVNGDRMSNGSVSVPDLVEGEIFIPPPPSMAPPPPPPTFIPPPPDFIANLDSSTLHLQPPSIPPPKPPSSAPSEEEDLTFLKPPPMAPPKPPSTSSSASTSSLPISTPRPTSVPQTDIKECPKFTPPQPPQKTQKNPPPKPTRMSSIPYLDGPPQTPAPAPPGQTSTPSSFNPQHTAKLYSVPKTSLLNEKVELEKKPKQILLLQDTETDTFGVPLPVNGNTAVVPPAKPARRNSSGTQLDKDIQDLEKNLVATLPIPQTQGQTNVETPPKEAQQEGNKLAPTPQKGTPELQRASPVPLVVPEANQVKLEEPQGQRRSYSPFLDRKLRNLKGSEVPSAREGHAASPLALLMAAKEREKHRYSLASEKSGKTSEPQTTASIQPSESSPNSFTVIPKPISSTSLTSLDRPLERPKSMVLVEPTLAIQTPEPARSMETLPVNPVKFTPGNFSSSSLVVEKQSKEQVPSLSDPVRDEENGEEQCMPLLPPPPQFANFDDEVVGPPPSSPPPDPPLMKALPPTTIPVLPVKAPSPSPPTAIPVLPVKAPSPSPPTTIPVLPVKAPSPSPPTAVPVLPVKTPCPPPPTKPKPPFQIKTKSPPIQPPLTSLSSSQATLLSILQKKMLEMDQKMPVPLNEAEASTDDWGSQTDEDTKVPVFPKVTPTPAFSPKSKSSTLPVPPKGLDMQELESKVAKKAQDVSSKVTTSSGPHSKPPHGMTFTVRPGTKQPITLVSKGDSS